MADPTATVDWPFGTDADRDDPLTALRIAVTSSHPGWAYLVAFDRASEARPTDVEAAMLRSYLDSYIAYWYLPWFVAEIAKRPLDVDGGANGVVFHKFGQDDWGYRRQSYVSGWPWSVVWPALRDDPRHRDSPVRDPRSLERLLDRLHTYGTDRPSQRWLDWKAAHPEVFPAVAA